MDALAFACTSTLSSHLSFFPRNPRYASKNIYNFSPFFFSQKEGGKPRSNTLYSLLILELSTSFRSRRERVRRRSICNVLLQYFFPRSHLKNKRYGEKNKWANPISFNLVILSSFLLSFLLFPFSEIAVLSIRRRALISYLLQPTGSFTKIARWKQVSNIISAK